MKNNNKQTSPRVASIASKILSDPHSSKREKSVAASDLAQARGNIAARIAMNRAKKK